MKPILEVRNIWKEYMIGGKQQSYLSLRDSMTRILKPKVKPKQFWALKDVTFDVYEGECVGIIGRNGAGKSTLLKILSRITPPTKGYIKARGRVASLLEVGTGFHPELTGRENIYLNGAILGLRRVEISRKFDQIIDFSGVENFLDTPLKHYSSGMKLRLAFSVAAHLEPEILLIDEVLAVGDAAFQKKCLGKMDEVSKGGRTVLFVSHNLGAVEKLCSTSGLLRSGKLQLIGKTNDVINTYLSEESKPLNGNLEGLPRSGNGFVKIEEILLTDEFHRPVDTVVSGHSLIITIKYKAVDYFNEKIKNFNLGLAIYNNQGQFLTVLNNKMANMSLHDISLRGKVVCRIICPFIHGRFSAKLTLKIDGEDSDVIENALEFFVEEGDFYNSGYSNAWKRNGIYIPQKWEFSDGTI